MGRYSEAAAAAADLTNKQLGDQICSFSRFTPEQLDAFLPKQSDKQAFLDLMAQVEKETDMDTKLNFLRDNLQTAGKAALLALKYFV
jgi:hypothetical protein